MTSNMWVTLGTGTLQILGCLNCSLSCEICEGTGLWSLSEYFLNGYAKIQVHYFLQLLLWCSKAFTGQEGYIVPQVCPGSVTGRRPLSFTGCPDLLLFQFKGAPVLLKTTSKCLTLSLRVSPDTLRWKLISVACNCSLIVLVITKSSCP